MISTKSENRVSIESAIVAVYRDEIFRWSRYGENRFMGMQDLVEFARKQTRVVLTEMGPLGAIKPREFRMVLEVDPPAAGPFQ